METLKTRRLHSHPHPHPHMLVMHHFARVGNEVVVISSFNCATLDINARNACIGNPLWQTSDPTKVVKYCGSVLIDAGRCSLVGLIGKQQIVSPSYNKHLLKEL